MAATSLPLPLGSSAPPFSLPDPNGNVLSLDKLAVGAQATLVAFICNHCPYVKHIRSTFASRAREWQERSVAVVAINSNDAAAYPDDSPEAMVREIAEQGYTFPYLVDTDQDVAKAYGAACTPDLFLFDADGVLVYHGQFDSSRPGGGVRVTGDDVAAAVDAVLGGEPVSGVQRPSIGCSIKWKPGNEPS